MSESRLREKDKGHCEIFNTLYLEPLGLRLQSLEFFAIDLVALHLRGTEMALRVYQSPHELLLSPIGKWVDDDYHMDCLGVDGVGPTFYILPS